MRPLRAFASLALLLGTIFLAPAEAHAAEPGECVRYSPLNYCIEWSVDGHDTNPGGNGSGSGPPPVCYWVNIPPINDDPAIFADFDLLLPPPGAVLQWQSWECSDGRTTFNFRWVLDVPPEDTAWAVRVRISGRLAAPVIEASPALGTASIINVPVFVAVSNWTGAITDSACGGGLCVTVTATPKLSYTTGEPDTTAIACAGAGTTFDRARPPSDQAAKSGACAYVYQHRTGIEGRPAEWPGVVTVTWAITWLATNGQTGVLPSITRSTPLPRAVQEVQTVVVGGATP